MATGHIRKRETKGGISYQVIVESSSKDPISGKRTRIYKTFEKKKEAEAALNEMLYDLRRRSYTDDNNMTVSSVMTEWLNSKSLTLKETTLSRYKQQVDWYINPLLGKYPVSAVSVNMIQNWVNDIYSHPPTKKNEAKPLKPKSVKNIFLNLQAAFDYAVFMKLIPDNPCKHVNLPPVVKYEVQAFNEDEIRQILLCAKGTDLYFPIYLLIHTGMRRGELLGLCWKDVHIDNDIEHPYIDIVQTRLDACGKEIIDTPKTESSKRKIFLSQQARQEFLRYRTWSKEVLFRCGRIQSLSDLVIIREDGQTDNPNNFTRRWNKFLAANGIRRLKLHGLRHTCATMLLKNNVDIKSIATRLGHSDGTMVLNVYGHSLDSMSQAAAETMDKVLNIS